MATLQIGQTKHPCTKQSPNKSSSQLQSVYGKSICLIIHFLIKPERLNRTNEQKKFQISHAILSKRS